MAGKGSKDWQGRQRPSAALRATKMCRFLLASFFAHAIGIPRLSVCIGTMDAIHAKVQSSGTATDVFETVKDVQFLRKCLRKAGLDEDLIGDVAEACELNDLDSLGLGIAELSTQECADRLFLTQDEAKSLLEVCRQQCLRAGVCFGDGAVYVPGPDDEWTPEPDPNAPAPAPPLVGSSSPPNHAEPDRRRRSSSARRSSEDGLGLNFQTRKSPHGGPHPTKSPRPSHDGPGGSPTAPHLETMQEEPRPVHKPQLTLAQSLSRAESAKQQLTQEPSNGTLASQVAIKHALKQQQKQEQAEQQAILQRQKQEQQQAAAQAKADAAAAKAEAAMAKAAAAKEASRQAAASAAAAAAARAAARTPTTTARPSSAATPTSSTAASTPAADVASRQSRVNTPTSTTSSRSKPAGPSSAPAATPNEADSLGKASRTPSASAVASLPRPLGTSFTLDPTGGPEASGRQSESSGVGGPTASGGAWRKLQSAPAASATPPGSAPVSSRYGGLFGRQAAAPVTAAAVAAASRGAMTQRATPVTPPVRPQSAAAPVPSYARPTQSTKAAYHSRLAEGTGGDPQAATAAALGLHDTGAPASASGAPSLSPSASMPARRASPSKHMPQSGDEKVPKKSVFAHISASLLRPTKAFLAWSSGKTKEGAEDPQKQFKARPLPKYMSSASMRRSVDLGSMHANGGGGGTASSYARRSTTLQKGPGGSELTHAPSGPRAAPPATTSPSARNSLGGQSSGSPATSPTARDASAAQADVGGASGSGAVQGRATTSHIPTTPGTSSGGMTPDVGRSGIPRPPTVN